MSRHTSSAGFLITAKTGGLLCGLLCCLLPAIVLADEPTASYIFPAGGQRGTTVDFLVGGHYLHDNAAFHMEAAPGEYTRYLRRQPQTLWFEGPLLPLPESQQKEDYPVDHRGTVQIAADAYTGTRWWRVSTSQGVTSGMPFIIGDLPEITEQEVDGRPIPAEVKLPVTVNGRIYPREDIDVWTFAAGAGEVISCEVSAQRLSSPLDATLQVTGPTGTVIARCDDSAGKDPLLTFTAPETGTYAVHLWDADLGGLQHYVYRLTLQRGPVVQAVYPLGARSGTTVSVEMIGAGLPRNTQQIEIPAGSGSEFRLPDAAHLPFEISEQPEILEQEPNNDPQSGLSAAAGTVLNGRIQQAADCDFWQLSLKKGVAVQLKITATELRSPLDSLLQVFDTAGKLVAESDDAVAGVSDSLLTFQPNEDGVYSVRISDRFESRGGPNFSYRLSVRETAALQPSFRLRLQADALNLKRGGDAKVQITADRQNGHVAAIPLEVTGLPAGVSVAGTEIAAGKNETQLTFKAEPTARIDVSALRIRSTQQLNEFSAEVLATIQGANLAADRQFLWLAVTVPTPFRFTGDFETRYAARGSAFTRRYRIERGGYEGPLLVSLAERQTRHLQGVTGPVVEVPAGQTEFEFTVSLPPWMEIGRTSRTCLMAVGQVTTEDGRSHSVSYTSFEQNDQIIVLVDPGRINLSLDRNTLLAVGGTEAQLPFEVQRGPDSSGPLQVELIVPRHMQGIECDAVRLTGEQSAGILNLRFAADAVGPLNMPLLVRATTGTAAARTIAEASLTLLQQNP